MQVPEPPPGPLTQRVEDGFVRTSPYQGNAFLHHCQRLYAFSKMLFEREGIHVPADSMYALALYHDLGLVAPDVDGPTYMHRSLALLRRDVGDARLDLAPHVVDEVILLNHRVHPLRGASRVAELVRRAVWIEHSRGALRWGGMTFAEARAVFDRYPRLDLDRVLLDFARRTALREPHTIVRGIFA
jgi:hypothetical protein